VIRTQVRLEHMRPIPTVQELLAGPARRHADAVMIEGVNILNVEIPIDKGTARTMAQPGAGTTQVVPAPIPSVVIIGTAARSGGVSYPRVLNEGGPRRGPGGATPVAAIERWARRRGVQPRTGSLRSFAFAVSRAHARDGAKHGPNYASGPKRGQETRGWFDRVGQSIQRAMPRLLEALKADIAKEWNSRARA